MKLGYQHGTQEKAEVQIQETAIMKANRIIEMPDRHWANDETIRRPMNVIRDLALPHPESGPGLQFHTIESSNAPESFEGNDVPPDEMHETLVARSFSLAFASMQKRPKNGFVPFQTESDTGTREGHGHRKGTARRGLSRRTLALAFSYMEANIGRNFALDELARSVGISRFHFCRLFRESTGKSPMEFLQYLRIDRAKEILLQGDRKICEVAVTLGFFDQSHFSRTFRRLTALAPSEYVRMCEIMEVSV